jgi:ferritin-like metal-binding protein YciE
MVLHMVIKSQLKRHICSWQKKLEKISNQNLEETEKIKIKIIRGDEIILMLKNQQILDAGIIAALFLWISDI